MSDTKPPLVRDALRTMREQRRFWVDLPGGARVQLERPREAELASYVGGVVRLEHVQAQAVDWQGVTEATLVGAAGGSEPLPFDRDLWAEWVGDNVLMAQGVIEALRNAITAHLEKKADLGNG